MLKITHISILFIIIISGCSHEPSFQISNNDIYKKGYDDGCKTANGIYTKNHKLFNDNLDYHEGWFSGRQKCNH